MVGKFYTVERVMYFISERADVNCDKAAQKRLLESLAKAGILPSNLDLDASAFTSRERSPGPCKFIHNGQNLG